MSYIFFKYMPALALPDFSAIDSIRLSAISCGCLAV
jgi:hypothetical protein